MAELTGFFLYKLGTIVSEAVSNRKEKTYVCSCNMLRVAQMFVGIGPMYELVGLK